MNQPFYFPGPDLYDSKMKLQKKHVLQPSLKRSASFSHKGMQILHPFRSLPIPIKKSKRVLAAGLCTEEVSCSNSRRIARGFQRFGETSVNEGGRISTAINPQGLFPPNASFQCQVSLPLASLHCFHSFIFFKEQRENLFCELN
ncbi:hypothetical protein AVEN_204505-1 [Araneus ventricosus]|uniref:Uncharacterized protein n=1 Tax=Araneus ventricosus TaxID=182803 RepID=A0A4Y2VLK6_ARAVE|nr:hypothetical protein AVEN_204505-1 [Araneus ventricosus]